MKNPLAAALTLALLSFRALAADTPPAAASPPGTGVVAQKSFDEADLDRHTDACSDFYQFACGGWIAQAEIPPDRPGWSRGFYAIDKRNETLLREVLDGYAQAKPVDPEQAKLGDYYAACTDESRVESDSLATLKRRLAPVAAIKDVRGLAVQIARAQLEGIGAFFDFGNAQDFRDSSQMIAEADQGGLSLPDRQYYLAEDGKFPEIRSQFLAHVAAMFTLLGDGPVAAKAAAKTVLRLETALAKVSMDRVARRDPRNVYHRLERAGLAKLTPTLPWDAYFEALAYPQIQAVNVAVPEFFAGLDALLKATPLADLQTYLRWHILARAAPAMAARFVNEQFRFQSRAFTGQAELPPRWKRCVGATLHAMGQPLGKAFVQRTFGDQGKATTQSMIQDIEAVLGRDLQTLAWMDDPTRAAALAKLAKVVNQIGYPDHWRSYVGLKVARSSYLDNALASAVFESRFYLGKIGKPVDRTEWDMPPSMVNAYYSSENNKMVFPAGILQAPFFDNAAPTPVNYGAIGVVMGHELTHGYDDQGRKFDDGGNLREWWTPQVAKEFDQRAQCLVDQYSGFVAVDSLHVNGQLTLGENIADQGGVRLSYEAWTAKSRGEGPEVAGFTAKQQFFLGFAQSWCTKMRPEAQRMRVTTDPHAPPKFRVNGSLANFPEFSTAFACKEGAAMAPAKRCRIW